jgi:hypothetical protein
MDCKYHQVSLNKKDRPKTCFSIGGETYQWKVMPFGMATSPAVFERLMEHVLHGLTYEICLVYLDDLLCFSTTFDEHIEHLRQMFERLRDANLKLSPDKCCFFQRSVSFLGHKISENGIEACPEKIKSVSQWPRPENVKQVRQFIGLCSYYRKMVPDFATIAKPLHQLTEIKQPFIWDDLCEAAFQQLKKLLTSTPILAYPIQNIPYTLDCDCSNKGLGSVLQQTQDNQERVIGYYSRCLT